MHDQRRLDAHCGPISTVNSFTFPGYETVGNRGYTSTPVTLDCRTKHTQLSHLMKDLSVEDLKKKRSKTKMVNYISCFCNINNLLAVFFESINTYCIFCLLKVTQFNGLCYEPLSADMQRRTEYLLPSAYQILSNN